EVVQNTAFTFCNEKKKVLGSYIRLIDYDNSYLKKYKALEAIQDKDCGWFYIADQNNFKKIPDSQIGYWISKVILNTFSKQNIEDLFETKKGLVTMNDKFFVREWFEISFDDIGFHQINKNEFIKNSYKW